MFEFTRQTIINSDTYNGQNIFVSSQKGDDKILVIKKHFKFTDKNIEAVYKREYAAGSPAEVTFVLDDFITEAGTYRFVFYIGLAMSSQDSFYANNLVYKGKPLYIEFPVKASDIENNALKDSNEIVKRIIAIAKKYALLYTDEDLLVVTNEGEGVIKFTGKYDYQIIRTANLEKYNAEGGMTVACCSNLGEFEVIAEGVVLQEDEELGDNQVEITPNVEAFGNYAWMIHNLRIPTTYNTRWDAPLEDEAPARGGQYTQYTIHQKSGVRVGIAGEAVGMGVQSYTTHVFYVDDSVKDAFETALTGLGVTIKTVPETSGDSEGTEEGNDVVSGDDSGTGTGN
jgi:hypothetical protein